MSSHRRQTPHFQIIRAACDSRSRSRWADYGCDSQPLRGASRETFGRVSPSSTAVSRAAARRTNAYGSRVAGRSIIAARMREPVSALPASAVCAGCGGELAPTRTTTWTVQVRCDQCGCWRQLTDSETDDWLRYLAVVCPGCGLPMRVLRPMGGGLVLACVSEVCGGRRELAAIDQAIRGDPSSSRTWFEPVRADRIERRICSTCGLSKPAHLVPEEAECVDCR